MINGNYIKSQENVAASLGFELEKRRCGNPKCSKTFDVLKTSKQQHCGVACATEMGVEIAPRKMPPQKPIQENKEAQKEPKEKKSLDNDSATLKDVPRGTSSKLSLSPKKRTFEDEWADAVKEAIIVKLNFGKARMEIAAKALYVCEIVRGGQAHLDPNDTIYNVKKFAEDIGVHHKTLSQWIRIKRNVYDKVGDAWDPLDFARAVRTDSIVGTDADPKKVLKVYLNNRKVKESGARIIRISKSVLFLSQKISKHGLGNSEVDDALQLLENIKKLEKSVKKALQNIEQ